MSKLQEEFDKLIAERQELNKRFQEKAQEVFKETTKEFFEKNPGITAVIWTQYTPYFNDGETCTFGVGDPYFTNADGEDMEDVTSYGEYDGDNEEVWSESSWSLSSDSEYARKNREGKDMSGIDIASVDHFSSMIQSSEMEDIMLMMFGDHARVTATREGFEVDEYDHD
jgi:hypothetical protein